MLGNILKALQSKLNGRHREIKMALLRVKCGYLIWCKDGSIGFHILLSENTALNFKSFYLYWVVNYNEQNDQLFY